MAPSGVHEQVAHRCRDTLQCHRARVCWFGIESSVVATLFGGTSICDFDGPRFVALPADVSEAFQALGTLVGNVR